MFKNSKNVHNLKKMYISSTFVCHFSKKKSGISENVRVFQKFFKMCLFKIFTTVREMIGTPIFFMYYNLFEISINVPVFILFPKISKNDGLMLLLQKLFAIAKTFVVFPFIFWSCKKIHVPKIVCVSIIIWN